MLKPSKYLLSRLKNAVRAEWHYLLAHIGIVRFSHLPTFVSIEPASVCNLRCPECPVGNPDIKNSDPKSIYQQPTAHNQYTIQPKYISVPLYKNILRQLTPYIHTVQLFFQGEPLLNRDLPLLIRLARSQGLYTIVSTNAQLLSPALAAKLIRAGLSRLIVSIDGITEQSYSAYRQGGNLGKALAGLTAAATAKKQLQADTIIEWQCLRLKTNEKEWKKIKREYKHSGADRLVFKTAQLYDYANGNPLMPSQERYSRYRRISQSKHTEPTSDNQQQEKQTRYRLYRPWYKTRICHRLFTGCVITTAGEVLPCCFDKSAQYSFGNLTDFPANNSATNNTNFTSIWHSAAADTFRRSVMNATDKMRSTHSPRPLICHNCTE